MKCYIFCSAKEPDMEFLKSLDFSDSFIICADGGYNTVKKLGIKADLWVGDMDSYNGMEDLSYTEKILFPSDKDLTDSHIAADEAIKRNIKEIYFIGATGGRLDHEYANYCLLKYILKKGAFGYIINRNNKIFLLDKEAKIYPENYKYLSFFPFGKDVKNFCVKNAKYELQNYHLTDDVTYTVSNEFLENEPAEVSFSDGYVLIMCSSDVK